MIEVRSDLGGAALEPLLDGPLSVLRITHVVLCSGTKNLQIFATSVVVSITWTRTARTPNQTGRGNADLGYAQTGNTLPL